MQRKIVVISHQHDTNIARNFFRCNCGSCSTETLVQAKETRCCTEISNCVDALVLAGSQNTCITNHPAFDAICLNRWSLELASDRFKTRSGQRYQQVESKDRLVHIIHVMCCHFFSSHFMQPQHKYQNIQCRYAEGLHVSINIQYTDDFNFQCYLCPIFPQ